MNQYIEQIHSSAVHRLGIEKLKPEVQLLNAICAEFDAMQRSMRLITTFQEVLDAMQAKGREIPTAQEQQQAFQQFRQNLSLQ